jgi:hypothetical protein
MTTVGPSSSFDFSTGIRTGRFVFLATATGNVAKEDRKRPIAYAAEVDGWDGVVVDCVRVKVPITVYAHACSRIAEIVDRELEPPETLQVWTPQIGVEKYLYEYAAHWLKHKTSVSTRGEEIEAVALWKKLHKRHASPGCALPMFFGKPQREPYFLARLAALSSLCSAALAHGAAASWIGPQIFESIEAAAEQFAGR